MARMTNYLSGANAPATAYPWDKTAINAAYRQYLGRDAGEGDYEAQRQNPGGLAGVVNTVKTSQAAQDYAAAQAKADTTTDTTTTTGTAWKAPTNNAYGVTGKQTGVGGTGAGQYAYTGFDFAQDAKNRSTDKSAKYAFAEATRLAAEKGVAADVWKTKEGAQYFAESYIKPYLEQQGFQVVEIIGDKMRLVTAEDLAAGNTNGTWVDFVVNAGGDNPALAWQAEQANIWGDTGTKRDTTSFGTPLDIYGTGATTTPPPETTTDTATGTDTNTDGAADDPTGWDYYRQKYYANQNPY